MESLHYWCKINIPFIALYRAVAIGNKESINFKSTFSGSPYTAGKIAEKAVWGVYF